MIYDLLIKNGTVVDGTGAPRRDADIAVKNGRIAAIDASGVIKDSTAKVIDAEGQIVFPGFVDPHTHYAAQITWDRLLSSPAEHGVTTAVMGNCGVGIAPCRPEARDLFFGFKVRGRLTPDASADIVVFDADTIGSPERTGMFQVLPFA
jgi:N-acyl-D-amino-acid deacylase